MKANSQRRSTPAAPALADFLNPGFLRKARKELERTGFVSDEHDFAPYGESLKDHCKEIERELRRLGFPGHLTPGVIKNHPTAGYAYYVYDSNRFHDRREAEAEISRWLYRRYRDELQA